MRCHTRVCSSDDFADARVRDALAAVSCDPPPTRRRKAWESAMTLLAFEHAGVLDTDGSCLAVAAGHEELIYHLTSRFEWVVATDLYLAEGDWSAHEASSGMLIDPDRFAPGPYRRDRLTVTHMDALDLRFPDGRFDAVYSLSSIEHFGRTRLVDSMAEMIRVVRPGGVIVVTTEILVDGGDAVDVPGLHLFTPEELAEQVEELPGVSLLDGIDLRIPTERSAPVAVADVIRMRTLGAEPADMIRVRDLQGREFTSVSLALRKDVS